MNTSAIISGLLKGFKTRLNVWVVVWLLVVLSLLGHNGYLWLGKRINPDTDILALLPTQQRDPVLQQSFTHMVDAAQQRMLVLIGAEDWDTAKKAADAYTRVLQAQPQVFDLSTFSAKSQGDWLATFEGSRLRLVSEKQREQLKTLSAESWTEIALNKLYSAFSGPKLGAFRDDPFASFETWMQERAQETPVRPRDGYLFVSDEKKQYVLLPVNLIPSVFSVSAQETVMPIVKEAESKARATNKGNAVEIISTGVILHAAAAGQQAHQEVSTIGVGSLLGVIVLMFLSFRSLKPVSLIFLSIGVGFLGALSVCILLFGRIHLMTLVFGASLIGIAQDYGIYFLCHRLGNTDLDSRLLLKKLMPGLTLTLLCAVIGYLGLALTPFPGLRHMAVFSAVGLLFAWLTVICWFPFFLSQESLKKGAIVAWNQAALPWLTLPNSTVARYILLFTLMVFSALGLMRLRANDDIRTLQNSPKQLISDQLKFGKLLDSPTPVQYFLLRADTLESLLQREEALKRKLAPLVERKVISGYQAVSNWVPSIQVQNENRALIQEKLFDQGGALGLLAARIGEEPEWAQQISEHLRKFDKPMTMDDFLRSPAGEASKHLWLGKINGEYASIVALKGLQYAKISELSNLANAAEGVQWVDKISEISSILGRYREKMGAVLIGAYVLVFALMFHRYGRHTWRTLAPAASASLLTLALLAWMGQALQLFHVLALMLLLGIGVDYGIFMQERTRDLTQDNVSASSINLAWLATGLSAVSTLLSFGLLALSNTPALHAFGLSMLIGTAIVWIMVPLFVQNNSVCDAKSDTKK